MIIQQLFKKSLILTHRQILLKTFKFNFCSDKNNEQKVVNKIAPKQIIDSDEIIDQKVQILAKIVQESSYPIFFTGAGISTSIGIPDYRSGENTVIKTGPGLWNRSDQQLKEIQTTKKRVQSLVDFATPSLTHMSIKTLIEKGKFKHLVSQNTDGLHLRSGIKKQNLSELHGNRNLEFCLNCNKKYLRDFRTIQRQDKHYKPGQKRSHQTGRHCENCQGQLLDSIIYFGQKLPKQDLIKSFNQAAKSDLCIAIGSSLTVKPSSTVPLYPLKYNKNGKLVIINIQQTPLDQYATLKISGFCDDVMSKLMRKLKIDPLSFTVQRFIELKVRIMQSNMIEIKISGSDEFHDHFSFIKNVKIMRKNQSQKSADYGEGHYNIDKNGVIQLNSVFKFQQRIEDLRDKDLVISFFGLLPNLTLKGDKIVDDIQAQQRQKQIGKEVVNLISAISEQYQNWEINQSAQLL